MDLNLHFWFDAEYDFQMMTLMLSRLNLYDLAFLVHSLNIDMNRKHKLYDIKLNAIHQVIKKNDYSKIFYVLKDRNSIARNRQFYNLVKRVEV